MGYTASGQPLRSRWTLLLFAAIVFAVYCRALTCDFVDFDDDLYVTNNARIQDGLGFDTFAWIWTATVGVQWYPLTLLSHLIDVSLFGLNPAGHHATSVMLHALNAVLLFVALRALTHQSWPSAIVAALFAFHPLRVESVVWVAERKDVLCAMFWILALCAWAAYTRAPTTPRYLRTLALFACALMSKPMAVTFPCVLLLLDAWPLYRFQKAGAIRLVLEKLPFFGLAIAVAGITIFTQSAGGALASTAAMAPGVRVLNALGAYGIYIWQSFVPSRLAVIYPVPDHPVLGIRAVAGAALLVAWLCAGLAMRRSRPYVLIGALWYIGVLVPVIGFVHVGPQAHADRYTYLSQIGLLIAVVWFAWGLVAHSAPRRRALAATTALVCLVLSVLTIIQIGHWRTSQALFARALAVTSQNSRAELGYGRALLRADRPRDALPHLQAAVRLEPGLIHARRDLALAWSALGHPQSAWNVATEALALFPGHPELLSVAASAALNDDRPADAARLISDWLAADPANTGAWVNLGIAQGQLGLSAQSEQSLLRALSLDPQHPEAHYNLGVLYARAGETSRAINHFRNALKSNPDHVLATQALDALR